MTPAIWRPSLGASATSSSAGTLTCSATRRSTRPARSSGDGRRSSAKTRAAKESFARAVGFEYPDVAGALADLDAELSELRAELGEDPAPETEPDPRHFAELGDVLFAAVNVARRLNVDPELALRTATERFRDRVETAERLAAEQGETWVELPITDQDRYFDRAKEGGR